MSIYEKIDNARKLLGLGENATIKEIKEAYKNLCLKYHPDRCEEKDKKKYEEMIRKLNESMEILLNYCVNYNISFKKEDIKKNTIDYQEYYFETFFDDLWRKNKKWKQK